jgi:hypothetical protein
MHQPYGVLLACLRHARTDESVRHPCCVSKPRGRKVCALKQSLGVTILWRSSAPRESYRDSQIVNPSLQA